MVSNVVWGKYGICRLSTNSEKDMFCDLPVIAANDSSIMDDTSSYCASRIGMLNIMLYEADRSTAALITEISISNTSIAEK